MLPRLPSAQLSTTSRWAKPGSSLAAWEWVPAATAAKFNTTSDARASIAWSNTLTTRELPILIARKATARSSGSAAPSRVCRAKSYSSSRRSESKSAALIRTLRFEMSIESDLCSALAGFCHKGIFRWRMLLNLGRSARGWKEEGKAGLPKEQRPRPPRRRNTQHICSGARKNSFPVHQAADHNICKSESSCNPFLTELH